MSPLASPPRRPFVVCTAVLFAVLASAVPAGAQEFLDRVQEALDLSTPNGQARVNFSSLFDLEGYVYQDPPPGLIFGDTAFVNPRLRLFGEAQFGEQ